MMNAEMTDLHDLYGCDVCPDVAVGVPPALKINDAEEFLLTSGDSALIFAIAPVNYRTGQSFASHGTTIRSSATAGIDQ
jgi:hypothetical protein